MLRARRIGPVLLTQSATDRRVYAYVGAWWLRLWPPGAGLVR
jgi:hypothetical protein